MVDYFLPKYTDVGLLLHPNIPKPLHNVSPRTVMGEAWWNVTRRMAYKANNFCCVACGIHRSATKEKWLEAHEDYSINYAAHTMTVKQIIALCNQCHSYIHSGRLYVLATKGEIEWSTFWEVMERGGKLLTKNGRQFNPFAVAVIIAAIDEAPGEIPSWAKKGYLVHSLAHNPIPGDEDDIVESWSKWRLVFEGVEYPPYFKDYSAWLAHYHPRRPKARYGTFEDMIFGIEDIYF